MSRQEIKAAQTSGPLLVNPLMCLYAAGVDLVPFWTLAVANVWRRAKREAQRENKVPTQVHTEDKPNLLPQRWA